MESILTLLKIKPSPESWDYVEKKQQFQLHTLLTEQRHPRTWDLSYVVKADIEKGLKQILSVDKDIVRKFNKIAEDPDQIKKPVFAVQQALMDKRQIFIYGCGSTGRLAKQMESSVWRPFWRRLRKSKQWAKVRSGVHKDIENKLTGEMTGGDRALISSLEGLEDLRLVGELQLKDHRIKKGDVVFCITEGGETSSVIGAVLAAADLYPKTKADDISASSDNIFFIFNNPEELIRPFYRSRCVLDHDGITKLNLTTGPQALAGSTRMQAATSETFFMGAVLEKALCEFLRSYLTRDDLIGLGFDPERQIWLRLLELKEINSILHASTHKIARLTDLEAETYAGSGFTTYFARKALAAVFVDCTERSPTFHLFPLYTVKDRERKSWLQVWTEGKDHLTAWRNLLGREFRGMQKQFYLPYFKERIEDPYLKEAAIRSLKQAGSSQQELYDFSFSEANVKRRGPEKGDLGVLVCLDREIDYLTEPGSSFGRFIELFKKQDARIGLIYIGSDQEEKILSLAFRAGLDPDNDVIVPIRLPESPDPLGLNQQIAVKILLNAHSTAVMAKLGRIVGNTMTNVVPSNLKLIGRATHLIMSHVNYTLLQQEWLSCYGSRRPVSYGESNAVLFDIMNFFADRETQISEVDMSIIRILESLKKNQYVKLEQSLVLAQDPGLENYLKKL
jgi:N-acetylmuramic acid 6-phosphate etherase